MQRKYFESHRSPLLVDYLKLELKKQVKLIFVILHPELLQVLKII